MMDYQFMTATEAMCHAKEVSGMTAEEIAHAAGVRPSVIRRYLQNDDGYSHSFYQAGTVAPAFFRQDTAPKGLDAAL